MTATIVAARCRENADKTHAPLRLDRPCPAAEGVARADRAASGLAAVPVKIGGQRQSLNLATALEVNGDFP